ncbi:hypothetical protein [Moraxella lacunata]
MMTTYRASIGSPAVMMGALSSKKTIWTCFCSCFCSVGVRVL